MDFVSVVRERMKSLGMTRAQLAERVKGKVGKTALYDFLWTPPYRPPHEEPSRFPPRIKVTYYEPTQWAIGVRGRKAPPRGLKPLPKRLPPSGINSKSLELIFDALGLTVVAANEKPPQANEPRG